MDEDQSHNHQEKPSVEMFVATAMKQSELLQNRPRTAKVMGTEKDPRNAYCIDRNRPREPAHRMRGPLEAFGKPHPLAMHEKSGSM